MYYSRPVRISFRCPGGGVNPAATHHDIEAQLQVLLHDLVHIDPFAVLTEKPAGVACVIGTVVTQPTDFPAALNF